jgi:hypothetical protein
MEYSLLGPTGVKLSRICLGMATFSVAPDAQESDNCLSVKEERSAACPRRAQGTTERHAHAMTSKRRSGSYAWVLGLRKRDAHLGPIWANASARGHEPLIPDTR